MRKVAMIAARPLTYLTRMLVPGEPFDCDIVFALIAKRRGNAVLQQDAEARSRARRSSYRRRDFTAKA
jgi:hypothetical protein